MVNTVDRPRVLMVDFAPPKFSKAMIQKEVPDYKKILPPSLGDSYVDREKILDEFGGDITDPRLWHQIYSRYPEATLMYGVIELLKTHAVTVAGTMRSVWKDAKVPIQPPYLIPTQSISERRLDFRMSDPVRPAVYIAIEPEPVIAAVANARQEFPDLCVLDLSLQMGPLGYQYEIDDEVKEGRKAATPIIKYAYEGADALQNVPKLFPICAAFPDLLVIAPAGNGQDDLRAVRREYQNSWPKGLLIGGAWHGDEARNNGVEGADVYLEQYSYQYGSLAAGALAALGSMLGGLETTPEHKIARIMELTQFTSIDQKPVYRLLDAAMAGRLFAAGDESIRK